MYVLNCNLGAPCMQRSDSKKSWGPKHSPFGRVLCKWKTFLPFPVPSLPPSPPLSSLSSVSDEGRLLSISF